MALPLRPVSHEARLPLLEHVSELRTRLVITLAAVVVAFGFAFWQNHALLNVLNRPLVRASAGALKHSHGPLAQTARVQQTLGVALDRQRVAFELLARSSAPLAAAQRQALNSAARGDAAVVAVTPTEPQGRQPVTLGLGEPFIQTLTVAGYFALLFALPVVLWQLYAFITPAFSPGERRVALPLMAMAPLLFIAGIAFGYFVVLPGAVGFLQNFNASSFDALVQASTYYRFILLTLLAAVLPDSGCRHWTHPHRDREYASAAQAPPPAHRCPRRAGAVATRHRRRDHVPRARPHAGSLRAQRVRRRPVRAPLMSQRTRTNDSPGILVNSV